MKRTRLFNWLAFVFGAASISLSWYWFGWELPLVITLALIGNNFQTRVQYITKDDLDYLSTIYSWKPKSDNK